MVTHFLSWPASRWLGGTCLLALAALPADAQNIQLRERWTSRALPAFDVVTSIAGMAETPDGTLWLSDPRNHVIHGVESAGASVRAVARAGDGPGEVRSPNFIAATPDGGLAVYDMEHRAIHVFDRSGKFRHRVALSAMVTNPKGFTMTPTGAFVISGGIYGSEYAIHRFGINGSLERSWLSAPKAADMQAGILIAGGPIAVLRSGTLLFSRAAPHELIEFSLDGNRLRTVAADSTLLKPVENDFITETGSGSGRRRSFRWNFPQSRAVFQLADGRILNVINSVEAGTSLWQLYTSEGGFLSQTRIDRAYAPWFITRSGDILASYIDPDTHEHIAVRLEMRTR